MFTNLGDNTVIDGYIYFIYEDDVLLYVGQSMDWVDKRLDQHQIRWPDSEATVRTTQELRDDYHLSVDMDIDEIEGLMIAIHNPLHNKRGPDLKAVHPWPPGVREESPRRKRAKEIIAILRSYKRETHR